MSGDQDFEIVQFDEPYALETVKMWRASMEQALGIKDEHSWEDQLDYLRSLVAEYRVFLAIDPQVECVIGMMAAGGTELDQLYVHVDYQGCGVGTRLLNLAKELSPGKLQLYTFEVNKPAQQFYEKHGFTIIHRGIEAKSGMADIRYEWKAGTEK